MASHLPLPSSLPERLRMVLEMRNKEHACPSEVEAVLARISYFHAKKPATRFAHITNPQDGFRRDDRREDGWRGSSGSGSGSGSSGGFTRGHYDYHTVRGERADDNRGTDGFEVWHSRRRGPQRAPYVPGAPERPTGYSRHERREHDTRAPTVAREATSTSAATTASAVTTAATATTTVTTATATTAKFSSAAVKAMDVEDRMLARVKGKINKIGHSTYDATKVFMEQILSSDDTEFLDELMKYVFQKAATESSFCPLYARLIHELADEFTHFRTVMINLFRDYTAIFSEVTTAPDPGTESYRAFVEAQERKKFRRGYSQFVAELVKMGEVDKIAFANLIQQIVTVLETIHTDASNTLLCEEYVDCLANMCKSASGILREASWSAGVKDRLAALLAKPKASVPGFTNKGRFALMDLVDAGNRGWLYR